MFNDHPNCLIKKARTSLNSQWEFKMFGQITEFPEWSMSIHIVWWKNHWHSYMPNENPNCLMGKTLDSLNVQWTSKMFHGQISWIPKCSMNIRIVSWTNPLIPWMFNEHAACYGKITWFPQCPMNIQTWWTNLLIP